MRAIGASWGCVAVAVSSAIAPCAQADEFDAVPTSTNVHAIAGGRANPLTSRPHVPLAATGVRVLAMTPSPLSVDVGAVPQAPSYDLRLARAYQANRLAPIKQSMRVRGTGMKDAYLHGTSGARLSVGSSYHMQYRASGTGPGAAAGSAALMRMPVGTVNLRDGFESYAPVAMAGYDTYVSDRLKVGVEGGMMVGRSTAMYADDTLPDRAGVRPGGRNPVADVVMTYAF